MQYKKYDEKTKVLISKSKNPYLLPELNIPVSTAKGWIKKRLHLKLKYQPIDQETMKVTILRKENAQLKDEIRELKRRIELLNSVQKATKTTLKKLRINDPLVRFKIIKLIQKHKGRKSLRSALNDLSMSFSKYKRWNKEITDRKNYISDINKYRQNHQRSLSPTELRSLLNLYQNPAYFHLPLHAISTLARRLDLVHCSPRTWTKYARIFQVKRPKLKKIFKRGYPIGIKRNFPNVLWHMDVTEIKVRGRKVFLQVILDNHSRFVINWKLIKNWNGETSANLLNNTVEKYTSPLELMTDAGKENLNYHLYSVIENHEIQHLISKLNTHFSNSRIEAFFRMLKQNYLKKVKFNSMLGLEKHIRVYIDDYNNIIPHSALEGRTPEEAYFGMENDFYKDQFKIKSDEAIKLRIKEYKNR
ncbi:MAG: hypothetical protein CME70_11865 [Halobacteriovorax sp.]|nr:hypothetical protein [Halobacteriovorax sp.]|tara:strand:+ start:348367 stop:349617 length:1251 start_codon:yes stop_codon:yes gene_type:complete